VFHFLGGTGVGKWLHGFEDAPPCDIGADPERRPGMLSRSKASTDLLQVRPSVTWNSLQHRPRDTLHSALWWDGLCEPAAMTLH
jgi:hypothetical protein